METLAKEVRRGMGLALVRALRRRGRQGSARTLHETPLRPTPRSLTPHRAKRVEGHTPTTMPKVTVSTPAPDPDVLYFEDTTDGTVYVIGESEDRNSYGLGFSLVALDGTSRSYGYRFPSVEAARANALSRHDLRPIYAGTITIEV